jgi:hypothetical protein
MINEKKTMGAAALAVAMAVVAVFGVVSCFDMASAEESKEYNIYFDLGGERASFMLYDSETVDYGGPEWVTVTAASAKDALIAACEEKFGEGSLELTSSGYIKSINGMLGNGLVFFSDQAFTGEASEWGISYYPLQFIKEADGWEYASTAIAGYNGKSTTFAVVCQPTSMDAEPVDFTFDEDAYAMSWDTMAMYYDDLDKRYEIMKDYYLWEYGTPSEPYFATTGVEILNDGAIGIGCTVNVPYSFSPSDATNTNLVWSSSDESVAIVDENGAVTGISAGTAVITAVTVDGYSAEIEVTVVEPAEYNIYIDLGGKVSAMIMGVDGDFGAPSWETVYATNAKDALTAACEQKFGEGSLVYKESSWGTSIDTINGMSGNGISFRSNEAESWDDVYYYPVQFVMEDGVWEQASVTIPNYVGESTTFAVVILPLTFDSIVHTFSDEKDQNIYDLLMNVYAWPGYGAPEYFITAEGEEFAVDGIVYTIYEFGDDCEVKVSGVEDGVTSVVIGKEVFYHGYVFDVEAVEFAAFIGTGIESATVKVDVEEYAFSKTPLKVLRLEGDIDVERGAFSFCKNLSNVYISDAVESIGDRAFYGCTFKDQNGDVVDPTVENLAGHKFLGSKSVLSMYVPELYSSFTVNDIVYKISSVDDMEVVVKGASEGASDILIMGTVNYLGFEWKVDSVASKAFYNNGAIEHVTIYDVGTIGMKAFAGCGSLVNVSLMGVETVGEYAFANSSVVNVICNVSVLGASAFSGCVGLTFIDFGDDLAEVGKNAFYKNLFYEDGVKINRTAANLAGKTFRGADGVLEAVE